MRVLVTAVLVLAIAPVARAQEEYYPLQEGHVWSYRGDGKAGNFTVRVKGKEKVGDVECFKVVEETAHGEKCQWLAVTKEGIQLYKRSQGKEDAPFDSPVTTLRFPLKVGDAWDAKSSITVGDATVKLEWNYKVEKEEDVTVSTGRYKAFKLVESVPMTQAVTTHWIAKDVGVVQIVVQFAGTTSTYKLEKFEKAKTTPTDGGKKK